MDTSFEVMINQVSNIGASVGLPGPRGGPVVPLVPGNPQANIQQQLIAQASVSRSRSIFTIWHVYNGKLTPLSPDWTFPAAKITAVEAINIWFLGEAATNTPPMEYLAVGHMKHSKTSADGLSKVRKFMKIVKYLGLKAGYWRADWNDENIDTLWERIVPELEAHVEMSSAARDGSIGCRTLLNGLNKRGSIIKEVADNPQVLTAQNESSVVMTTKAQEDGEGDGSEETTTSSSHDLELLWGIHHGKLQPFPEDWQFPSHRSMMDILHLWFFGVPEKKIPPMMYVHSSYVQFVKSGSGYLSKLRCVMKVIQHYGVKLGCWYDSGWDADKINTLWQTVWDEVEEHIKFKNCDGRVGEVTWQSVYNRIFESKLLASVSAEEKGAGEDGDGAGQAMEQSAIEEEV